jgi:hypothetical protein
VKKFSEEDLARLAEKVRTEISPQDPAIEKENPSGLNIGPPVSGTLNTSVATYTGFRFTETPGFFTNPRPKQTYLLDWSWTTIPWYARLLGLLRLPYDLTKFIVTGRLIVIPWPWRW